jgi:hypothetical protein
MAALSNANNGANDEDRQRGGGRAAVSSAKLAIFATFGDLPPPAVSLLGVLDRNAQACRLDDGGRSRRRCC